jgi:transcriptional regulator with XRE-family HTH domain
MSSFAVSSWKIGDLIANRNENYESIAKYVGVDISTISRIVTGKVKRPSQETIIKIAEYFNVPIDYILDDYGSSEKRIEDDFVSFSNVSDTLKFLMKETKIFEAIDLSKLTDISVATITKILNGSQKSVSDIVLSKLAKFFGVELSELLGKKAINVYKIKKGLVLNYFKVPIIEMKNIDKWISEKDDKYIGFFDRTYNKKISSNCFGIKVTDEKYGFEVRRNSILVFEVCDDLHFDRMLVGKIINKNEIFEASKDRNKILIRHIGKKKLYHFDLNDITIFGKLVEIKVS